MASFFILLVILALLSALVVVIGVLVSGPANLRQDLLAWLWEKVQGVISSVAQRDNTPIESEPPPPDVPPELFRLISYWNANDSSADIASHSGQAMVKTKFFQGHEKDTEGLCFITGMPASECRCPNHHR